MLKGFKLLAGLCNRSNIRYGNPGDNEYVEDIPYQDAWPFRLRLTYTLHRREDGK